MTENFQRTGISIHHNTRAEIDKRTQYNFNTSYVVDRDLTRYYSLVESCREAIDTQFTQPELVKASKALTQLSQQSAVSLRTMRPNMMRMLIANAVDNGDMDRALGNKALLLDNLTFCAWMDRLENIRPRSRRQTAV